MSKAGSGRRRKVGGLYVSEIPIDDWDHGRGGRPPRKSVKIVPTEAACPVCGKLFPFRHIEAHADRCAAQKFLTSPRGRLATHRTQRSTTSAPLRRALASKKATPAAFHQPTDLPYEPCGDQDEAATTLLASPTARQRHTTHPASLLPLRRGPSRAVSKRPSSAMNITTPAEGNTPEDQCDSHHSTQLMASSFSKPRREDVSESTPTVYCYGNMKTWSLPDDSDFVQFRNGPTVCCRVLPTRLEATVRQASERLAKLPPDAVSISTPKGVIDHKRTADLRRRIQEERYHLELYRTTKGSVADTQGSTEADCPPLVAATGATATAAPLKRRVDDASLSQEKTTLPKKRGKLVDTPSAETPAPACEVDVHAASGTNQRTASRLVMRVRVNEDGFECEHNPINPPHPKEKSHDQPHPPPANAEENEWTTHLDANPASSQGEPVVDPAFTELPATRTLQSPRRRSPPREQNGGLDDIDDTELGAPEPRPSLQRRQPTLGSNKPQGPKNHAFRSSRRVRPGGASSTGGTRQSKVIVPVVFSDSSESEDDNEEKSTLHENNQQKPPTDPPSSSLSSTAALQGPSAGAQASRRRLSHSPRLANHDALEYVERMRHKHKVSPNKIAQFVDHLKAFKNQQLTASEIAAKISTLLKDYPDLVEDFTKFLPLGDNPDEADSSASLTDAAARTSQLDGSADVQKSGKKSMKQTPSHPSPHHGYQEVSTTSAACEKTRLLAEVVDLTQDKAEFEDLHAVACNADVPQSRLAKRALTSKPPATHQQARHKGKMSTSHAVSRTQHATQKTSPPATESSTRQRTMSRETQHVAMTPNNNDLDNVYQRSGTNVQLPVCRRPPGITMRSSLQAGANEASREQPQRATLSQRHTDVASLQRLQDSARTARGRHNSKSQQPPPPAQSHVPNESSQSTPAFRRTAAQHQAIGRFSAIGTPSPAPTHRESRSKQDGIRERQPLDSIEASSPSNDDEDEAAKSPRDDHIVSLQSKLPSRRNVLQSSRNAGDETDSEVPETQSHSLKTCAEISRALTSAGDGRFASSSESNRLEVSRKGRDEQSQDLHVLQRRAREILALDAQDQSSRSANEKDKREAKATGEESGRIDSRKKQAERTRRLTDRTTHREKLYRADVENTGGESQLRPLITNAHRGTQTQHKSMAQEARQYKGPAADTSSVDHGTFPNANEDHTVSSSVNAKRSADLQRRHPEIRGVRRKNALDGADEGENGQQSLSSVQRPTNISTPASDNLSPVQRQKRRRRSTDEATNHGMASTEHRVQPSSPFHDRQLAPGIWWASSEESDVDDEIGIGGFSDQSDDGSAIDADYFSHPTRWSQDDGEERSITSDDAMQIGEIGTTSDEQSEEQEPTHGAKPQDEAPCLTNELAHAKAHVKHMLQDLIAVTGGSAREYVADYEQMKALAYKVWSHFTSDPTSFESFAAVVLRASVESNARNGSSPPPVNSVSSTTVEMFQSLESLFAPEDAALLDTLIDAQPDKDRIRSNLRRNLRDPILKRQRVAPSTSQAPSSGGAIDVASPVLNAKAQSDRGCAANGVPAPAPNERSGTVRSTMAHRAAELPQKSQPCAGPHRGDQENASHEAARKARNRSVPLSPPVPAVESNEVRCSTIDPALRAHQAAAAIGSIPLQSSATTESYHTTAISGPISQNNGPKTQSSAAGGLNVSASIECNAQTKATQQCPASARAIESATEEGQTVQSQKKTELGAKDLTKSDSNDNAGKHYAQLSNLLTLEQGRNNTAAQPANA